jgi:hypothetical protein
MDTITRAGRLEAKLRAVKAAGFTQIMLNSADLVGHPEGEQAAIAAVRESVLRVIGFQVLRDFEGPRTSASASTPTIPLRTRTTWTADRQPRKALEVS